MTLKDRTVTELRDYVSAVIDAVQCIEDNDSQYDTIPLGFLIDDINLEIDEKVKSVLTSARFYVYRGILSAVNEALANQGNTGLTTDDIHSAVHSLLVVLANDNNLFHDVATGVTTA